MWKFLKSCASQLSVVFSQLFTWSLKENILPFICKTSVFCPVRKIPNPSCLKDYRPTALTSIVMKCFERIILHQPMKHMKFHLDPYQFALQEQQKHRKDATLTLLHNVYTHLEKNKTKTGSFVRILFIDFSYASNSIQPHLMASKILKLDVNPRLILWIVDFLVSRSQTVRHQAALSSSRSISTGSPQGTVLSPILSTVYTNDCTGTGTTTNIKYSDDSAIEDLPNSDSVYFTVYFCLS